MMMKCTSWWMTTMVATGAGDGGDNSRRPEYDDSDVRPEDGDGDLADDGDLEDGNLMDVDETWEELPDMEVQDNREAGDDYHDDDSVADLMDVDETWEDLRNIEVQDNVESAIPTRRRVHFVENDVTSIREYDPDEVDGARTSIRWHFCVSEMLQENEVPCHLETHGRISLMQLLNFRIR